MKKIKAILASLALVLTFAIGGAVVDNATAEPADAGSWVTYNISPVTVTVYNLDGIAFKLAAKTSTSTKWAYDVQAVLQKVGYRLSVKYYDPWALTYKTVSYSCRTGTADIWRFLQTPTATSGWHPHTLYETKC